MAWVRMDDTFPTGPKVKRAARWLKKHGTPRYGHPRGRILAVWSHLMGHCNLNSTDGFFDDADMDELPDHKPIEVFDAMAIGDEFLGPIVERNDARKGWQIRNYGDYQPLKADKEASKQADAQRKRDERERKRLEKQAASEKRPTGRHDGRPKTVHVVSVVPSPSRPVPSRPDPEDQEPGQEQPPQTSAFHPLGEEISTEDQFNANDGRDVYEQFAERAREIIGGPVAVFRAPAENTGALTKIAHGVLAARDNGRIPALDVTGAVKDAAGAAGLAYGGDRVRKALDAAEHRRQRDTPISAALRIAEDVLRQAPGLTLPVLAFNQAIFDRTAHDYGDAPEFADAVRTLLYDPKWPKYEPEHFGSTDTLKDPDTGRRLLKPVVGAYFWRLQPGGTV